MDLINSLLLTVTQFARKPEHSLNCMFEQLTEHFIKADMNTVQILSLSMLLSYVKDPSNPAKNHSQH